MRTRTSFLFCLFAILVFLVSSAPAQADDQADKPTSAPTSTPYCKLEESLVIASAVADIATTEYFLRHNPMLAESNPLAQSTAARVGLKAGSTMGIIMLARHFDKQGAHKTARVIRWVTIGIWGGAAGWNLHLGLTIPVGGE